MQLRNALRKLNYYSDRQRINSLLLLFTTKAQRENLGVDNRHIPLIATPRGPNAIALD